MESLDIVFLSLKKINLNDFFNSLLENPISCILIIFIPFQTTSISIHPFLPTQLYNLRKKKKNRQVQFVLDTVLTQILMTYVLYQ